MMSNRTFAATAPGTATPLSAERDVNLDMMRGGAIFLLLWGHAIQYASLSKFDYFTNPVFIFIYSFHLPLFMVISGYLAFAGVTTRDLPTQLHALTKRLLIPTVAWSIIIYLAVSLVPSVLGLGDRTLSLRQLLVDGVQIGTTELWFLWVLLIANVLVLFVHAIFKDNILVYLATAVLLLVLPSGFPAYMLAFLYPFFVIGYLFHRFQPRTARIAPSVALVCAAAFPVMVLFYGRSIFVYVTGTSLWTSAFSSQIGIDVFRFAIGLVGCGMCCALVYYLGSKVGWLRFRQLFAWFGLNALVIYAVQRLLVQRWLGLVIPDLTRNILLYDFVITPLIAMVGAVLISLLCSLIRRNRTSRLLLLGGR
jgi:fucose 4-O-acetylase-like acetyltransferase